MAVIRSGEGQSLLKPQIVEKSFLDNLSYGWLMIFSSANILVSIIFNIYFAIYNAIELYNQDYARGQAMAVTDFNNSFAHHTEIINISFEDIENCYWNVGSIAIAQGIVGSAIFYALGMAGMYCYRSQKNNYTKVMLAISTLLPTLNVFAPWVWNKGYAVNTGFHSGYFSTYYKLCVDSGNALPVCTGPLFNWLVGAVEVDEYYGEKSYADNAVSQMSQSDRVILIFALSLLASVAFLLAMKVSDRTKELRSAREAELTVSTHTHTARVLPDQFNDATSIASDKLSVVAHEENPFDRLLG